LCVLMPPEAGGPVEPVESALWRRRSPPPTFGGRRGSMGSFRWSFHPAPLRAMGPHQLDYAPNLTCEDDTRRDPMDSREPTHNPPVAGSRPAGPTSADPAPVMSRGNSDFADHSEWYIVRTPITPPTRRRAQRAEVRPEGCPAVGSKARRHLRSGRAARGPHRKTSFGRVGELLAGGLLDWRRPGQRKAHPG
jgi:hypothetical protein